MKRLLTIALLLTLIACRREAAPPAQTEPAAAPPSLAAGVEPLREPVVLEDVVESDPRYILGITYPPAIDKYPGLAAELKAYSDAARADLLAAVAELDADTGPTLYDLALEFKIIADTPEVFAVAADGSSFTGGAHGAPLIARFVWLPQHDRLLTADALVPDPRAWREVSAFVREQLHAALSQRVDADDLDPVERERVVRSAGRMIDEGSTPEADSFSEFEPVLGADGRLAALRFVFPPYQVGPYSDGAQAVEVPARVLLPHVAADYRPLFSADPTPR
ncbi:RsiV family protein [Luteimonas saliphila]|uniref:RsiV family protein n=1 Tax=Luteimonas saliphila TaxID=2804919 RepID=UPI001EE1F0D0|nr:RsiV family protein [Luteimonas saliphila]